MNKIKGFLVYVLFMVVLGVVFGYLAGFQTTTLGKSCNDLNSSVSSYQCNAIKNPISTNGIQYYSMWIMFSPIIAIMFYQTVLLGKAYYMLFKGENKL